MGLREIPTTPPPRPPLPKEFKIKNKTPGASPLPFLSSAKICVENCLDLLAYIRLEHYHCDLAVWAYLLSFVNNIRHLCTRLLLMLELRGLLLLVSCWKKMTLPKDMMQPKVSQYPQFFLHTGSYLPQ